MKAQKGEPAPVAQPAETEGTTSETVSLTTEKETKRGFNWTNALLVAVVLLLLSVLLALVVVIVHLSTAAQQAAPMMEKVNMVTNALFDEETGEFSLDTVAGSFN